MNLIKLSLLLAPCLMMLGCGEPEPEPRVLPPTAAIRKCDALVPPQVGESAEKYLNYVIDAYADCLLRHDGAIDYIGLLTNPPSK